MERRERTAGAASGEACEVRVRALDELQAQGRVQREADERQGVIERPKHREGVGATVVGQRVRAAALNEAVASRLPRRVQAARGRARARADVTRPHVWPQACALRARCGPEPVGRSQVGQREAAAQQLRAHLVKDALLAACRRSEQAARGVHCRLGERNSGQVRSDPLQIRLAVDDALLNGGVDGQCAAVHIPAPQ